MAVLTILPEPIANPARVSTALHADITATSQGILSAYRVATGATIAEGTANAGTSTTAAVTAQAPETDHKPLRADGTLPPDECIEHLRTDNTDADFHTTLEVVGTASSEAEVKAAMYTYLNSLGQGGDVIEATLAAAALAAASVSEVLAYTFEENAVPTNTNDVTITAPDIVKNAEANTDVTVRTQVPIYVNVIAAGTATEEEIETVVTGYMNALAVAANVDQSVLEAAVLAHANVTSVGTCAIDITPTPTAEIDLTIAAGDIARTDATLITYTDSD